MLGKADEAHVEVVPEDLVHLLYLVLGGGKSPFLFFDLPFPSIEGGLPLYLDGLLIRVRKGRDDVLRLEEANLAQGAKLELLLEEVVAPLISQLGPWLLCHPVPIDQNLPAITDSVQARGLARRKCRMVTTEVESRGGLPNGLLGQSNTLEQLHGDERPQFSGPTMIIIDKLEVSGRMLSCQGWCVPSVSQVFHGGVARARHLGHDPVGNALLGEKSFDTRAEHVNPSLQRFRYWMRWANWHRRSCRSGHHEIKREWRVGFESL